MPMVTQRCGMSSSAPPRSPTELVARVSGWMSRARVLERGELLTGELRLGLVEGEVRR